jgi:hypothetical protein
MTEKPNESSDVFRIVRGNPTEEEVAAVVSVLAASREQPPEQEQRPQSGWAAYWRGVRAPIRPGPGSWQAAIRDW